MNFHADHPGAIAFDAGQRVAAWWSVQGVPHKRELGAKTKVASALMSTKIDGRRQVPLRESDGIRFVIRIVHGWIRRVHRRVFSRNLCATLKSRQP